MTTPPPESSRPFVTPTVAETNALSNATSDEEIRLLAQQLLKSGQLGFDPSTLLKGIVTAVDVTGSPPTVSIQISGDTTTTITSIRLMDNYTPRVGHTVLVDKLGPNIMVRGHIADSGATDVEAESVGWIRATLSAGSHNGNDNGDVYYRRILDHGSWKMQWRGGWAVSGTTMIDAGDALDEDYRPSSLRSLLTARTALERNGVKVDFNTDGTVELVGSTLSTANATVSGDVFNSSTGIITFTNSDSNANHNNVAHYHQLGNAHDHGFSGGSHSHATSSPTWVSLHGLEYFL